MRKINIYERRTNMQAIERMIYIRTYLKNTIFGNISTFTTEHVDIDYYKGRRKMAPFVSPRIAGRVMDRQGYTTKTFKPATIKPTRVQTGEDLSKRSMGENVYSTRTE